MHGSDDLYKILQVHHLAEPEVIESAYKRLAKKYHPDVSGNGSSEEMMKKLNRAFEVLSDSAKRQQYNLDWEEKHNKPGSKNNDSYTKNERSLLAAKSIIDEYFGNIMNKRFDFSYELISSFDKQNITKDDFINWQRAVSMVFHLSEYNCKVHETSRNKRLNGHLFCDAIEFSVDVVEYNTVMDMVGKDTFRKTIVLEEGKWRVFVGYEGLQPLIQKYKELTSLITAKSVISELVKTHSRVDSMTGLLNQRGIIEKVENEIHRFERYGNVFSLIMCCFAIVKVTDKSLEQKAKEHTVKITGEILLNNLRKLDVVGRWGENKFLILLPETGLSSAIRVTKKLFGLLKTDKSAQDDKPYKVNVKFGTAEYSSSLEEVLNRINRQIEL